MAGPTIRELSHSQQMRIRVKRERRALKSSSLLTLLVLAHNLSDEPGGRVDMREGLELLLVVVRLCVVGEEHMRLKKGVWGGAGPPVKIS